MSIRVNQKSSKYVVVVRVSDNDVILHALDLRIMILNDVVESGHVPGALRLLRRGYVPHKNCSDPLIIYTVTQVRTHTLWSLLFFLMTTAEHCSLASCER